VTWHRLLDEMVDRLVADGFIGSPRVEAAFRTIPRHDFLPGEPFPKVYDPHRAIPTHVDGGVPVSSSSAPDIMGLMLERLGVGSGDRVLEIGTGTGYNAALLSLLVTPSGSVTTIDIDPAITAAARPRLRGAGPGAPADPVRVVDGDGWLGWPEGAPSAEEPVVRLQGLYDRAAGSLALVADGNLRAYGGDAALRRLRDRLRTLRSLPPFDLRHLQIEAVPDGPSGGTVLPRPSFDLVVRLSPPTGA
jgi:protein-L-isoaspartate O-methyltransferase